MLKVLHSLSSSAQSADDLLLGYAAIDSRFLWNSLVSLCGWIPVLSMQSEVVGEIKVSYFETIITFAVVCVPGSRVCSLSRKLLFRGLPGQAVPRLLIVLCTGVYYDIVYSFLVTQQS